MKSLLVEDFVVVRRVYYSRHIEVSRALRATQTETANRINKKNSTFSRSIINVTAKWINV